MSQKEEEPTARKKLPQFSHGLIAHARNDVTVPYFTDVLSPIDETLIARGQGKGLKLYDELERDTHAYAVLQKRKFALVGRDWAVTPASDSALDRRAAKCVEDQLKKINFDQLCLDLLDATLKGFSIAEIVWMREGAAIIPSKIVAHDPRRFVFDEFWRPRLLTMEAPLKGLELPERKFIVHRFGAKGNNPYGLGLGSKLFWPVLFKREGVAFWLTFLEKFASPTPVGKYPLGMLPQDQRKILDTLLDMRQTGAIVVPLGTDVSFLETARSGTVSYQDWCKYWDMQMALCVFGSTLATQIEGQGSRAASETHKETEEQIIDADADLLSDSLRNSLFQWLIDYNFPGAAAPSVSRPRPKNDALHEDLRAKKIDNAKKEMEALLALFARVPSEKFAETAGALASAGLMPQIAPEVLKKFSIFSQGQTEKITTEAGAQGEASRTPEQKPAQLSEGEAAPDPAQTLADASESAAAPCLQDWIKAIRGDLDDAVAADEDLQKFSERLLRLEPQLSVDPMGRIFAQAIERAELTGRANVWDEMRRDKRGSVSLADDFLVPFEEAITYFRQKLNLPSKTWRDIEGRAHDRAFIVAGAMKEALLADFRAAIDEAVAGKLTLKQFAEKFEEIVAKHGWTGWAGEKTAAGRAWRARVIYETNMRTAYAAGRYAQMTDPDVVKIFKWWRYKHAYYREPVRARPEHREVWNGLVLAWNDPWWDSHYPPNGWNCSCGVENLTDADLTNEGIRPDKAPDIAMRVVVDPATGQETLVPMGIDFGWDHAPGRDWSRGLVPKELQQPLKPAIGPEAPRAPLPVLASTPFHSPLAPEGKTPEFYVGEFLKGFGAGIGAPIIWRDPSGHVLAISDELFRDGQGRLKITKGDRQRHVARLAEAIIDPDEIWIDWGLDQQSQPRLVRRYLRTAPDSPEYAAFSWSSAGWHGATAFTPQKSKAQKPNPDYLERQRKGALLWRRPAGVLPGKDDSKSADENDSEE